MKLSMRLLLAILALGLAITLAGCVSKQGGTNASQPQQEETVNSVPSNPANSPTNEEPMQINTININANGNTFEVELVDNAATRALVERLETAPVTHTASDYGNFEKVGSLGFSLPTQDEQISTAPGDVILYQGDKVCIYYGTNSWSFTRLGKIKDTANLKERLGEGDVEITLSL